MTVNHNLRPSIQKASTNAMISDLLIILYGPPKSKYFLFPLLSRQWNVSWLWNVNAMVWVVRATFGHAGWPWATSDRRATTCARSTAVPPRWWWTAMGLASPSPTGSSGSPQRMIWYTLRTRLTTAYGTMNLVSFAEHSMLYFAYCAYLFQRRLFCVALPCICHRMR